MSKKQKQESTPRWCDLTCPHASWPESADMDGSGSCRTFLALECKLHGRIVAKNAPCLGAKKPDKPKG